MCLFRIEHNMGKNQQEKVKNLRVCTEKLSTDISKNMSSGKNERYNLNTFTEVEFHVLQQIVEQDFPNGVISEARLTKVYAEIFPMGNVSKYVKLVFNSMDQERNGYIQSGQFMQFISILARGSTRARALLCFNMLDNGRDRVLRKQNFKQVFI